MSNLSQRFPQGATTSSSDITNNSIVIGDGGSREIENSSAFISDDGEMTNPSQPAFMAWMDTTVALVTGDGSVYTVAFDTEAFDQNDDFLSTTFTAPVTGKYDFEFMTLLVSGTDITGSFSKIVSSNNTFKFNGFFQGADSSSVSVGAILADMDVADTCTLTVQATDSGGKVLSLAGDNNGIRSFFSGVLVC